jgi:hypothetical protein
MYRRGPIRSKTVITNKTKEQINTCSYFRMLTVVEKEKDVAIRTIEVATHHRDHH